MSNHPLPSHTLAAPLHPPNRFDYIDGPPFLRSPITMSKSILSTGLTCFLPEITTTPRVGYGSLRTDTREDCEAKCETDAVVNALCISFAFSQSQGLCVFQNANAVDGRMPLCAKIASYTRPVAILFKSMREACVPRANEHGCWATSLSFTQPERRRRTAAVCTRLPNQRRLVFNFDEH
ncbi:hypothetical protein PRIPAC_83043 [Pristionchus pacificus]|uniref:Apple domain-containing protein n=1 Tax=Pristionchus pacificus TaxID=54126 RepID=A0A2A6BXL8_PRIPA|nr:hypothetical protein PRIPAC_83043 [Pristionchus pacificus]|eukprot:PDM70501.1 hypothetical protein PRIPAC_46747 [Pristionchus pacificus]